MTKKSYKAGDSIFQEGDPSGFVCRIISGEVEITKEIDNRPVVLGTVKAGEFVGEMGVIEGKPRSATVRTKTEVQADLLNREEFLHLMSKDTGSAYQLIARLCERLRTVDQKLAEATVSRERTPEPSKQVAPPTPATHVTVYEESSANDQEVQLTMLPNADLVAGGFPSEGLPITEFPFNIGRRPEPQEKAPYLKIHLCIQDTPPYRLSRIHFTFEKTAQGYLVRDLGSTLGTQVNGEFLGNDFAHDSSPLQKGENHILAGGMDSPFSFQVQVK